MAGDPLDEIIRFHGEGLLTDREVVLKIQLAFPLDARQAPLFWERVPEWMKEAVVTYFAFDGEQSDLFHWRVARNIQKEADIKAWLVKEGYLLQ
ncbi:hypothetical protein [Acanthopleuribacter pedis]|uniref:Uncharacterized protein n=1 Tax=Acanthopleuribacter pedis TaxID=442870 RepID=A0A8J7QCE9_9BACT|nr:hypothetical protein [Acanthopleuribacter pedis]MBO1318416.1 hypothetical protein [Acanthopleuribacter pedis]